MTSTRQTGAKIGWLPAVSPCGDKPQYANVNGYTPSTSNKKTNNNSQFNEDDYIYKGFNAGVENFNNLYTPMLFGVNVRLVGKRNFDDKGRASEHNFAYFLKKDDIKWGFGYQYFNFIGLKKLTSLPVGVLWGVETKIFSLTDSLSKNVARAYLGIPIGARGLINIKGIILSPDLYYHIAVSSSKVETDLDKKANYMVLGANVRWKFLYGGAHLNLGKSINYFGIRAGVSL